MSVFTDRFSSLAAGTVGADAVFRGSRIRVLFIEDDTVIENGIETRKPTVECLASDVPDVTKGMTITVDETEYAITLVEATNTKGIMRLTLSKEITI